jgi:DNA-binding GntR family transcriptional regulator
MPVPLHTPRITRNLIREQAYVTLRDWIVDGVLKPGEQLRDQALAEKLGTSRTPVREALRRLEDEGLVVTSINRWTRVSSLDMDEAQRIYPILWTLEPLAMQLAAPNLTPADLQEMAETNAELKRALRQNDPLRASRADHDFHDAFVRRCDNPDLIRIIGDLKIKLRRLEVMYFEGHVVAQKSVREHRAILADMEKGDWDSAALHVQANWQNSLQRVTASPSLARREGESGQIAATS